MLSLFLLQLVHTILEHCMGFGEYSGPFLRLLIGGIGSSAQLIALVRSLDKGRNRLIVSNRHQPYVRQVSSALRYFMWSLSVGMLLLSQQAVGSLDASNAVSLLARNISVSQGFAEHQGGGQQIQNHAVQYSAVRTATVNQSLQRSSLVLQNVPNPGDDLVLPAASTWTTSTMQAFATVAPLVTPSVTSTPRAAQPVAVVIVNPQPQYPDTGYTTGDGDVQNSEFQPNGHVELWAQGCAPENPQQVCDDIDRLF